MIDCELTFVVFRDHKHFEVQDQTVYMFIVGREYERCIACGWETSNGELVWTRLARACFNLVDIIGLNEVKRTVAAVKHQKVD